MGRARPVLLLGLLAGCADRAPILEAPVALAPAARAWGVPVSRFLGPTALGARDETLCRWARGEAAPAELARWVAEGRLRWRVAVVAGPEPRLVGEPGPFVDTLAALAAADAALAARCGRASSAAPLLVLADRDASYGAVADAVELAREHGGALDAWLAVAGPAVEPPAPAAFHPGVPLVALVMPEERVAFSNREGRGYEGPVDTLAEPLAAAAAPERAGCVTFSAGPTTPWADVLTTMDIVRGLGVEMHTLDLEGAPGAGAAERAVVPTRPALRWTLGDTVAAVPVRTPSRCGGAPMGWWCDRACIPDTGLWPEPAESAPASAPSLGELVYRAHRVRLLEQRAGGGATARTLFDDGVLPDAPLAAAVAAPPAACADEAARAGVLRWLVFETVTEVGVARPAGWEEGALTSLDSAFEATVAAVIEALAWRQSLAKGEAPGDVLREAAVGEGPRAVLAWDALANPAWHGGRAAVGDTPRPPPPVVRDVCGGRGAGGP